MPPPTGAIPPLLLCFLWFLLPSLSLVLFCVGAEHRRSHPASPPRPASPPLFLSLPPPPTADRICARRGPQWRSSRSRRLEGVLPAVVRLTALHHETTSPWAAHRRRRPRRGSPPARAGPGCGHGRGARVAPDAAAHQRGRGPFPVSRLAPLRRLARVSRGVRPGRGEGGGGGRRRLGFLRRGGVRGRICIARRDATLFCVSIGLVGKIGNMFRSSVGGCFG